MPLCINQLIKTELERYDYMGALSDVEYSDDDDLDDEGGYDDNLEPSALQYHLYDEDMENMENEETPKKPPARKLGGGSSQKRDGGLSCKLVTSSSDRGSLGHGLGGGVGSGDRLTFAPSSSTKTTGSASRRTSSTPAKASTVVIGAAAAGFAQSRKFWWLMLRAVNYYL